jgi:tRNA(fMet)-specific endonuclease VapC
MTYFLDANICIYALKGTFPAIKQEIRSRRPSQIRIPSIVSAELRLGAQKSERSKKTRETLESFLAPFRIVPFDQQAALEYAEIRAALEQDGRPIGPNDLIIAATVNARNGILVTHNLGEFDRVNGLKTADWTKNE